jgi:pimeloyl-ACP methyl ester carboxylesterase
MDRRGTGLSDPVTRPPSLDERVDDLRAVLDSVDVDRPTFVGSGEGGSICILFAATHPERISTTSKTAGATGRWWTCSTDRRRTIPG